MEYLVRFTQTHESFRVPEIEALAELEGVDLKVLDYRQAVPFCTVALSSEDAARKLVRRAVLVQTIHELWGTGATMDELHASVKQRSSHLWPQHRDASFRFALDSFQGKRSPAARLAAIDSFDYLPLNGTIRMSAPDEEFTIFEEWAFEAVPDNLRDPERVYLGRLVAKGARDLPQRYDLKKRGYISTTSMDAELALVTANVALAAPGKLVYDPFVGTGGFPLACAHFGALAFGADIDGRSFRGDGGERSTAGNFRQYGLGDRLGDLLAADLTNSPVRVPTARRLFDAVVCDPPYGVREGLHVLGCRDPEKTPWVVEAGIKHWNSPQFVPPKKPYGFKAILDDILAFATETLVDNGRLSFWMPAANEELDEYPIPAHPCLRVVSVCVQPFTKWSRRLITYRRLPDSEVDAAAVEAYRRVHPVAGKTADELNPFRVSYFKKAEG